MTKSNNDKELFMHWEKFSKKKFKMLYPSALENEEMLKLPNRNIKGRQIRDTILIYVLMRFLCFIFYIEVQHIRS